MLRCSNAVLAGLLCVVATTPAYSQSNTAFESPPVLAGSELAPSALPIFDGYQAKEAPFARIAMANLVPVGPQRNGTLLAGVAIDYAYWDRTASEFARAGMTVHTVFVLSIIHGCRLRLVARECVALLLS